MVRAENFKVGMKLPEQFQLRYDTIKNRFLSIRDTWKEYNDELIPEDVDFAVEILEFFQDMLEFSIRMHETEESDMCIEILRYIHLELLYGPNGDDHCYISFDIDYKGEVVSEFFWEINDCDDRPNVVLLNRALKKVIYVLDEYKKQK